MDITHLTITELKALAYDTFVQIEQFQNNLKLINQQIVEKLKQIPTDVEEKVEETPVL